MPTFEEKIRCYKDAIHQMYCIEGKSLNYISKLFKLDRKNMTYVIKHVWGFEQKYVKHTTPSIRKLLNAHRDYLIKVFDAQVVKTKGFVYDVLESRGIPYGSWKSMRLNDPDLDRAYTSYLALPSPTQIDKKRKEDFHTNRKGDDLEGEVWKDIMGYEGYYEVSNKGRIRNFVTKEFVKAYLNKRLNRYEVHLHKNGKRKCHKRYRLVAHAFCEGFDPDLRSTVNHKDGDTTNDVAENLEWASQLDQGYHAATVLKKGFHAGYSKYGKFKKIIIDDKFEFKTITAAARFTGVSVTQFYRYLDGSCKWDRTFEFIY